MVCQSVLTLTPPQQSSGAALWLFWFSLAPLCGPLRGRNGSDWCAQSNPFLCPFVPICISFFSCFGDALHWISLRHFKLGNVREFAASVGPPRPVVQVQVGPAVSRIAGRR